MTHRYFIDLTGRVAANDPRMLESHVSLAVQGFLRAKGWLVTPANAELLKRSKDRQAQPDVADLWCIHVLFFPLFIEVKRPKRRDGSRVLPGGKLRPGQIAWGMERAKEGFEYVVVDDVNIFQKWYEGSAH